MGVPGTVPGTEAEILDQTEGTENQETETPDLESQTDDTIVDGEGENTEEVEAGEGEESVDEEQQNENPEEEIGLTTPPFNKLQKEFPEVFKKYPQIRANFFKAEKYAEYFPTVQEAESASRKVEIFDAVDGQLTQGDFKFLIDTLHHSNPNGLNRVADEIVPLLTEKNPQLYVKVANPIFKGLITKGLEVADRYENSSDEKSKAHGQALKQVFNVLKHFIWGEAGIPAESPKVQQEDPEKLALRQQLQQQFISSAAKFEEGTKTKGYNELKKIIDAGIADPENKLTDFTRNKLTEQIIYDINVKMAQDPKTAKEMQALWINAARNGFSEQSMVSINRAFLTRAKMIIPRIRQNRLSEALGTTVKAGNGKTQIPSGGGGIQKNKSARLTPADVKAKGLSEADIINFGAK